MGAQTIYAETTQIVMTDSNGRVLDVDNDHPIYVIWSRKHNIRHFMQCYIIDGKHQVWRSLGFEIANLDVSVFHDQKIDQKFEYNIQNLSKL